MDNPKFININNAMDYTLLLWVVAQKNHQAIQIFLNHNADPNVIDI